MRCVCAGRPRWTGRCVVVDVSPEVYELVRLVAHLAVCLYAEYGGGLRYPFRALKHIIFNLQRNYE